MEEITTQLRNFLQYIALQFIKEPKAAELRISHPEEKRVSFRLILAQPDVATLIGRQGFTSSTIRSMMKAACEREGVKMSLTIHSHEEEQEYLARKAAQEEEE